MGGAAGVAGGLSTMFSAGSGLLGSAQSAQDKNQSQLDSQNQPTKVGETSTLGMMNPYSYGNIQGMTGSSQNNSYNTAMSPKPLGLQDMMQMGQNGQSGGSGK